MYRFKKHAAMFFNRCGYMLTYPAVLLYKFFGFLNHMGIGGLFSEVLLLWCIFRTIQGIRYGNSIFFTIVIYVLLFGFIGTLGAYILESVLQLFVNALQSIKDTNENLKQSMKKNAERTVEDYIYEMRHKKAYNVEKR